MDIFQVLLVPDFFEYATKSLAVSDTVGPFNPKNVVVLRRYGVRVIPVKLCCETMTLLDGNQLVDISCPCRSNGSGVVQF
jgi:hypothetical protein